MSTVNVYQSVTITGTLGEVTLSIAYSSPDQAVQEDLAQLYARTLRDVRDIVNVEEDHEHSSDR